MNNPYSAPTADLSLEPSQGETYEPAVFALRGRIGRLRYLAYSWLWYIPAMLVLGILLGFGGLTPGQLDMFSYASAVLVVPLAVRRLHDIERNGWLSLLMVIPVFNIFFSLYLLFAPGTDGTNKYGPAPCKNSRMVRAGLWVLPLVVFIGILAAIAIPAYQDYLNKAIAAKAAAPGAVQQP